ncbi:hypothetical protein ILUMI_06143 [Ignelater luminosus]|uniref:Ion transport domain-containing protein n=1 Tax=Ignelater luminosus TaxID=2038154 RepID=A0A8K0D6C2_IGNLU|nr:hypothetical protein ILUMI_06143 [Ignelater luminosus]
MESKEFRRKESDKNGKSSAMQLLHYVTNNEPISKIEDFISDNPEALTKLTGHPFNKPILYVVCHELANTVNLEYVKMLIKSGADLYYADQLHNYKQALHFATLGGNPQILQIIIGSLRYGDINLLSDGNTALNLLIKEGDSKNPDFFKCVKLLIQADIDVKLPDKENLTPEFWAVKKGYSDVVQAISQKRKQEVDIGSHTVKEEFAEDYIVKNDFKDVLEDVSPNSGNSETNSSNILDILFNFLRNHNENDFINCKYLADFADSDDGVLTLLQSATEKGLSKAVETLLNLGTNPNRTTATTTTTPIEIASMKDYFEIFTLLLKSEKTIIPSHLLIRTIVRDGLHRSLYYSLLMEHKSEFNINIPDIHGNTALHYAILFGGPEKTLDLLRAGASMATKNKCGISPVEIIDASILEIHLDECVDANLEVDIYNEMFIAQYNYTTLISPKTMASDNIINEETHDAEASNKLTVEEIPRLTSEIDVISSISNSEELKPLLHHPVLTSFIYMKWHRIRWVFYLTLGIYIIFCLSLFLYILIAYNNQHNNEYRAIGNILLGLLCATFLLLVLRKILQFVVLKTPYFYNIENWLDVTVIFLTATIIFKSSPSEPLRKQLSSFAVLSAALELVIFLGYHPEVSTNVTMFRTVFLTFVKFLWWYSILIFSFAFSFYTLFKDTDDQLHSFMDPGRSLFKTIIMLTGEFDASQIRFQTYPVTSHIIFMLFVFMVTIVLFNLLNGLAISDTQLIKSDSELIGHMARIRQITFVENVMLSSFLRNNVLTVIQKFCCCLSSSLTHQSLTGILVNRIFLFPYNLRRYCAGVFPNRAKVVLIDGETEMAYATICLDKQTARRTKQLIRRRKEILEQKKKEQSVIEIQRSIVEMQKSVSEMQELLRKEQLIISKKLDSTITRLRISKDKRTIES